MIQDIEKLNQLITECLLRRLTTEEALEHIKKNGMKLSERSYRRYKKELEDKTEERLLAESEVIRDQQVLLGLNSYKKIEKERWNLFDSTKNELIKTRILDSLEKSQDRIYEYYKNVTWRAGPIKRKIEEKEKEEERNKLQWESDPEDDFGKKSKSKSNAVCN